MMGDACARYCRKSRRSNPETVAPAISKPAAATPISTIPVINNNVPANAKEIRGAEVTRTPGRLLFFVRLYARKQEKNCPLRCELSGCLSAIPPEVPEGGYPVVKTWLKCWYPSARRRRGLPTPSCDAGDKLELQCAA